MKYYETHFEEYVSSVENLNIHPELNKIIDKFPKNIDELENLIIYGPPGSGKYSQVLNLLRKYSPSELKYDKKITANTEKQQYTYRISDIHFEIDMSLLGCNSKILWHEIFFQIVDIISVKPKKIGIILCKNFHLIHAELLEIFYSYIQQYNHKQSNIKIKFFLMMEHISFLPTPIINACHLLRIGTPNKEKYKEMILNNKNEHNLEEGFPNRISEYKKKNKIDNIHSTEFANQSINIINETDIGNILNIKETRFFPLVSFTKELPKDAFNIICDNIIKDILEPNNIVFTSFRDTLYEILTYNLDMAECLWYIISYFIDNGHLKNKDISDILKKTYTFLKYYNNNYRPIYHLESIIFYIINKVHNYNEL
jgi:hypothetical protein